VISKQYLYYQKIWGNFLSQESFWEAWSFLEHGSAASADQKKFTQRVFPLGKWMVPRKDCLRSENSQML